MSVLVPAPPRLTLQLAILAPLMEAIIVNRATATSASRTRLFMLLDMAGAMHALTTRQCQAVMGDAK